MPRRLPEIQDSYFFKGWMGATLSMQAFRKSWKLPHDIYSPAAFLISINSANKGLQYIKPDFNMMRLKLYSRPLDFTLTPNPVFYIVFFIKIRFFT